MKQLLLPLTLLLAGAVSCLADNRVRPHSPDQPFLFTPQPPQPPRPPLPPKPVVPPGGGAKAEELPKGEFTVDDLKVRAILLTPESNDPIKKSAILGSPPCLTWTADAKGFYGIDHETNTVRLFSFPELKEEASLTVGKEISWISLSKEGLVVNVSGADEAWVLDPKSLKKGKTFPTTKAKRVLSTVGLSVAYVFDRSEQTFKNDTLRVVDLKTGKDLKEYTGAELALKCDCNNPVISADGKHLFCTNTFEMLFQFALDGQKVTHVTTSDRLCAGGQFQPVVSADGKLVCAPSGHGNVGTKLKNREEYTTFVFAPGALDTPLCVLKTGPTPQAVGFDTAAGLIYAQNMESQLIVLDKEGKELKSYKLTKNFESPLQLLPHPDGRKLLVFLSGGGMSSSSKVYSVELPAKK